MEGNGGNIQRLFSTTVFGPQGSVTADLADAGAQGHSLREMRYSCCRWETNSTAWKLRPKSCQYLT